MPPSSATTMASNTCCPSPRTTTRSRRRLQTSKPEPAARICTTRYPAAVGLLRDRPPSRRRVIIVVGEAQGRRQRRKARRGPARGAAFKHRDLHRGAFDDGGRVALRASSSPGPIQATPPGTFGVPPMPGTAQTPTSEQQRTGNIDLTGFGRVGRAECDGRREGSSARSRDRRDRRNVPVHVPRPLDRKRGRCDRRQSSTRSTR